MPTNTYVTTLSHKALYLILREPVTYKTISQISSFILRVLYTYTDIDVGTPTCTLSLANAHKHPHTCIDIWPPLEKKTLVVQQVKYMDLSFRIILMYCHSQLLFFYEAFGIQCF